MFDSGNFSRNSRSFHLLSYSLFLKTQTQGYSVSAKYHPDSQTNCSYSECIDLSYSLGVKYLNFLFHPK